MVWLLLDGCWCDAGWLLCDCLVLGVWLVVGAVCLVAGVLEVCCCLLCGCLRITLWLVVWWCVFGGWWFGCLLLVAGWLLGGVVAVWLLGG